MRRTFLFFTGLIFLGATLVEAGFLFVRLRPAHAAHTTSLQAEELLPPAPTGTPAPVSALIPGGTVQHRVVEGEWLIQIARCYGVNLNDLSAANPQVSDPSQALEAGVRSTFQFSITFTATLSLEIAASGKAPCSQRHKKRRLIFQTSVVYAM